MPRSGLVWITGWLLVGLACARLAQFGMRVVVAQLGVAELGVFALASQLLTFFVLVAGLGFDGFIVREVAGVGLNARRKVLHASLAVLVPVSCVIAVVVFVGAPVFGAWLHVPLVVPALRMAVFSLPVLVVLRVVMMYFRGSMQWRKYVACEDVAKDVLRLIGTGAGVVVIGTVSGALLGQAVGLFVLLGVVVFLVRSDVFVKWSIGFGVWRRAFLFATPLYGATLALASLEWIDSVLVGSLLCVRELGVYSAARSLAVALTIVPSASVTFFLPVLVRVSGNGASWKSYYSRMVAWNLALSGFLASVTVLWGRLLLQTLFGEAYVEGYLSLVILAVGFWLGYSVISARTFLFIRRRGGVLLAIACAAVVCNIVLGVLLTSWLSSVGAALATVASLLLVHGCYVLVAYREFGVMPLTGQVFVTIVAFGGVVVSVLVFNSLPYFWLLSVLILLGYVGVHALFESWRNDFKQLVDRLWKRV